jgi:hypothetical protein
MATPTTMATTESDFLNPEPWTMSGLLPPIIGILKNLAIAGMHS